MTGGSVLRAGSTSRARRAVAPRRRALISEFCARSRFSENPGTGGELRDDCGHLYHNARAKARRDATRGTNASRVALIADEIEPVRRVVLHEDVHGIVATSANLHVRIEIRHRQGGVVALFVG